MDWRGEVSVGAILQELAWSTRFGHQRILQIPGAPTPRFGLLSSDIQGNV